MFAEVRDRKWLVFRRDLEEPGGGNSTVESHSSKVMVAGSNPVPRSKVSGTEEEFKSQGIEQISAEDIDDGQGEI